LARAIASIRATSSSGIFSEIVVMPGKYYLIYRLAILEKVVDRIAAAQREELEQEIASLVKEARALE
jgi:hypothetical protein